MYKKAFLTGCLGHTRRITQYRLIRQDSLMRKITGTHVIGNGPIGPIVLLGIYHKIFSSSLGWLKLFESSELKKILTYVVTIRV